jgi:alkylation response protein AidB-like acyl-CoA dehydrogenase
MSLTIEGIRVAVRAVLPEIRKLAPLAEENRQVPMGNMALLREAGFFRLVQPRVFGGLEQDFDALVELTIEISAACASTGWVAGIAAAHQWLVANFDEAAQHDVWGSNPEGSSAAPTHRPARPCQARAVFGRAGAGRSRAAAVAGANMAEFPTIQLCVAEAAASVDAARTILLRDLRAVMETLRAGTLVPVEQRITSRRGQAFAVSLAVRAAEALNASTGGHGLDMANPVQRAWRDANAVGRHISMNWDVVGTMYGQLALGLEPRGQY